MRPAIKAGLMALLEATGLYMRPVLILCLLRKEPLSVTLNRPRIGQDGATRCKHPNAFG
jgi:hypothetical protein